MSQAWTSYIVLSLLLAYVLGTALGLRQSEGLKELAFQLVSAASIELLAERRDDKELIDASTVKLRIRGRLLLTLRCSRRQKQL